MTSIQGQYAGSGKDCLEFVRTNYPDFWIITRRPTNHTVTFTNRITGLGGMFESNTEFLDFMKNPEEEVGKDRLIAKLRGEGSLVTSGYSFADDRQRHLDHAQKMVHYYAHGEGRHDSRAEEYAECWRDQWDEIFKQ